MSVISWVVKQGLTKTLGPVLGPMAMIGGSTIRFLDRQFAENDRAALEKARRINGDCPHILLAYASQTYSKGSVQEANDGDRQKTQQIGKRFAYPEMTYLFWHPCAAFLPDGNVSAVYLGSREAAPPATGQATLRAAPPARGAATCPFCTARTLDAMQEIEKHLQWSKSQK